jgi:hypothetical protein
LTGLLLCILAEQSNDHNCKVNSTSFLISIIQEQEILNSPLLWCWQPAFISGERELTNALKQSPSWDTKEFLS